MHLKSSFLTLTMTLVAFGAGVALVACGGGPSVDVPTVISTGGDVDGTVTASGFSDSHGAGIAGDGPQGPPEEALAACAGLSAEATCSFASPLDGANVDGTCRARRDDPSQYVCFPDDWDGRGPGHGRQGPPEEALAACEGVDTGASCSFEAPFGVVEGTCSQGPSDSDPVVCRPEWADGDGPFGPGEGNGHRRPGRGPRVAACEGLQVDAACSFEKPDGETASGTCRTGRDGSTLVCGSGDGPPR
jgi:hypothetical protein